VTSTRFLTHAIASASLALTLAASARAEPAETGPVAPSRVRFRADAGMLAVISHEIQQGDPGSTFDYRDEGGQDVLFFVKRFTASVDIADRHRLSFLYQPLELRTRTRLERDILIEGVTYTSGENLALGYGFPFYRATYEYALLQDDRTRLGIGGAAQIRNATIEFITTTGERLVSERDVGLVPLIHASFWRRLGGPCWFETELDGIYAPIKYLNGNDNGVEGALLDANARIGIDVGEHVAGFFNLRYLGGGAEGSSNEGDPADYNSNWLQFFIVSLGVELR
jgi:hypothetical protein